MVNFYYSNLGYRKSELSPICSDKRSTVIRIKEAIADKSLSEYLYPGNVFVGPLRPDPFKLR